MKHILALDQGTTSSRAVVYDGQLRSLASAQKEFAQHFPQPGWVEHDAAEIWESVLGTAREAIAKSAVDPGGIAAIGITNQRETIVVWDRKSGNPVHRAIVWQDRRTAEYVSALHQGGKEVLIQQRTGLLLDPYFSASKLHWILRQIPDGHARAAADRADPRVLPRPGRAHADAAIVSFSSWTSGPWTPCASDCRASLNSVQALTSGSQHVDANYRAW